MNNKIYIGHSVSFFGLKGEIKIVSTINHLDKVFKVGNNIFINDEEQTIHSFRIHKKNIIISLKGYDDINLIDKFLNQDIYINREDVILSADEYLYSDLLDNDVIFNNQKVGVVKEVLINKVDTLIRFNNIIVPLNNKYLEKIDIKNKIIYLKDIGELLV